MIFWRALQRPRGAPALATNAGHRAWLDPLLALVLQAAPQAREQVDLAEARRGLGAC